ncbi:MAG TPA: D-2-hydroxyacid dehydrogenase [Streptosporangiaceae bacterium]|nr:D-2-hydroxyacid dehydrogenase [Streptosporangiaceae bacterium]
MSELTIVIGSFLEEDQVKRIEGQSAARVIYEPDLLPVPRYPGDHTGKPRELSAAGLERWRSLGATADVFVDFDWHEPATMPDRCPRLRWIQATSAGIGGFMQRTGLDASGLTVTTAAGIHAVPLSEFAVMGALHFVKGVPQLQERQRASHWERYTTRQLAGLRTLVVGLGGIGRKVAQSFAALGVEVWGLGRDGRSYEVPGVSRVISRADLDDALPQIDVLVLACPLTAETEGMIGAAQIGLLKPDAVVVNIARGPVIDQAALIAALRDGRLAGACLDVFAVEPLPPDDPLWGLDNVIVSPHSASTVVTENAALVDLFLDNLDRFTAGLPLANLYVPARGY